MPKPRPTEPRRLAGPAQVPAHEPELPRLVDQVRILLWFQMYLSLIGVVAVLIWAAIVEKRRLVIFEDAGYSGVTYPAYSRLTDLRDQLLFAMAALVVVAVVLAVCAKLLRRGWKWVYLLILATQAVVVAIIVRGVTSGWTGGLLVLLYAALTGWILADLFRGEVLAFVWRRADRPDPVNPPQAR
jgi:hypothetical protein